jgi:hypothetical protein
VQRTNDAAAHVVAVTVVAAVLQVPRALIVSRVLLTSTMSPQSHNQARSSTQVDARKLATLDLRLSVQQALRLLRKMTTLPTPTPKNLVTVHVAVAVVAEEAKQPVAVRASRGAR